MIAFEIAWVLFTALFVVLAVRPALILWTATHDKHRKGSVSVTFQTWPLYLAFICLAVDLIWGR